jgi:phytanoyl-CoA hydroxylase
MNEGLIERYERDGYVVMEDLVSRSEVTELREEAEKLCLEKGAALSRDSDPTSSDPLAAYLAIHFPHKLSSRFREALARPRIVDALTSLIGPNVKCIQSMLFIKHAGKPGQAWHQDEDFIPTRGRSLIAGWIALDDATIDNGCLWRSPALTVRACFGRFVGMSIPSSTRFRNPSIFPTKRAMRGRSRSPWGRSFSSTAICCTNR